MNPEPKKVLWTNISENKQADIDESKFALDDDDCPIFQISCRIMKMMKTAPNQTRMMIV